MGGIDVCNMKVNFRELTRDELREICKLAFGMCANYDRDYECLLLNGKCYMSYGVAYTNSGLCKYFRNAVLPLNPQLEAVFNGELSGDTVKECAICGTAFYQFGRSRFCSDLCRAKSKRVQDRNSKRKQRENKERQSENSR